jgi:hypothetical protein
MGKRKNCYKKGFS